MIKYQHIKTLLDQREFQGAITFLNVSIIMSETKSILRIRSGFFKTNITGCCCKDRSCPSFQHVFILTNVKNENNDMEKVAV